MTRRLLLAAVAAAFPLAAPAPAQTPQPYVAVVPNVAGKASELRVDLRPDPAQSSQARNAQEIVLAVARGFRTDPRSRRARCSEAQAREFRCPEDSRIGYGQAEGTASGTLLPAGGQRFTASIDVFLAPPPRRGDVAGVVVQFREPQSGARGQARGRIVRVRSALFGSEVRFEELGGATPQFPGITVTVERIRVQVGARRTVRRTRTVRRGGRRVRVVRRVRYSLITNPPTCRAGGWPYEVRIRYPDRQDTRAGSLECSSR